MQLCAMENTFNILVSLLRGDIACAANFGARVHVSSTLISAGIYSSRPRARSGAYTTKHTFDTLTMEMNPCITTCRGMHDLTKIMTSSSDSFTIKGAIEELPICLRVGINMGQRPVSVTKCKW